MSIVKDFFLKNAAKFAARNLPKDQQEFLTSLIEKNPDLFSRIAAETQELIKKGKPEIYATFEVMQKYQRELQDVMKDQDPEKLQKIAANVSNTLDLDDVEPKEDKKD